VLTEPKTGQAVGTVDEWRQWYRSRGGLTGNRTWDDERLEYSFTVGGRGPAGQLELQAPEDTGAQLDWYSFDMTSPGALDHGPGAGLPPRTITAVPAPVRYKGMPASRWWEFEDGQVHFGDVESGPADLARLLVAEFATSYARDWFVVPVTVPVGSLTELVTVEAFDTFGGRTIVPSTAMADQDRIDRTGGTRVWRLFELTGDEVSGGHPSPWLLVAPSAASSVAGPALERVAFIRDEAANLAWGIEQLVEGPLGQPLDRAEAWYTSRPPVPGTQPPAPASGAGDLWQYRLEATAPPWWVPLVPERVDPATSAEVRLRRARMQAWALLGAGQVGPKSDLLDPSRPRWLYEEEVPAGGAQVERRWQLARWHDGSVHLWLQRRKRPGRGGGTSGVRWDLLEQPGDPARPPDS
jgi:hypothetical protein